MYVWYQKNICLYLGAKNKREIQPRYNFNHIYIYEIYKNFNQAIKHIRSKKRRINIVK